MRWMRRRRVVRARLMRSDCGKRGGTRATAGRKSVKYLVVFPDGIETTKRSFYATGDEAWASISWYECPPGHHGSQSGCSNSNGRGNRDANKCSRWCVNGVSDIFPEHVDGTFESHAIRVKRVE